jgi:signal transduction histidine kinase
MDMSEDNPYRKYIAKIQKPGENAAAIVLDLLTLARRGVSVDEVVNLDIIIREYLMSPEFEKLNNFGSPVHLSKTIMNLVSNAAEAMPDGGTIAISTENSFIDRPISGYDDIEDQRDIAFSILR